jgi:NAD(P)-dependent dehydrogenase (short-subunit alcohol dehydrogenase family)
MLVQNKVALVTGAARGIGAQCARQLAENGAAAVIVVDMDEARGKETADSLSSLCRSAFYRTDVSSEDAVKALFHEVKRDFGRLDILVNIAGICSTRTIFDENMDSWDRIMNVNLKGGFLCMREAFLLMEAHGYGRIVNMASISGQVGGIRTSPAYAASKAGLICITKSFAKLGAKLGITVNALAPGLVDTEMTRDPDFHYSVDEVPMGRVASTSEIANTVLYLASDLAAYVTGQCVNVNGGMYMG